METRASILKQRVGKLSNPFEDHKCNKTEDILQSDTESNKTRFSNLTYGGAQAGAANTTFGGAQAVNRDRRAARRQSWTVVY